MAGTSRGCAYSRSMRSRARRRCVRSAISSGVMPRTVRDRSPCCGRVAGTCTGHSKPSARRVRQPGLSKRSRRARDPKRDRTSSGPGPEAGVGDVVSREPSTDFEALLRRHGVQVTAQRLAVLRAVAERPHSTADDIDKVVRADIGAISRQAVYDALGGPHRQGPRPAHPAGRVTGPLRGSGRRQPPPPDLPNMRPDGRRRLRRRLHAVPDGRRRLRLRDRRSRGHLLGPVPRVRRGSTAESSSSVTQPPERQPRRATSQRTRPRRDRRQREREPSNPVPDAEAAPAADEPGLVAEPARPVGPPPAFAARQPDGPGLRLRRGVRVASTSRR